MLVLSNPGSNEVLECIVSCNVGVVDVGVVDVVVVVLVVVVVVVVVS